MFDLDHLYALQELEEFNEGLIFDEEGGEEEDNWEQEPMLFGKYKGEPLSVVAKDTRYCDWMIKSDFHITKDKSLRDMLNDYLLWKKSLEKYLPPIDNSKLEDKDVDPLSIDSVPWIVVARQEFVPVAYTEVGKWLLFFDKIDLSERWKQIKYFYNTGFFEGVFQIKCSTRYDNPRAGDKSSGVIALYCCLSYEQDRIIQIGKDILRLIGLTNTTIYYKTDEQSHSGTRVNQSVNHIYKLKLSTN